MIGELYIDEEVTYDSITHTGLGVTVNPLQVDKTPKHTASASAGSEADLPRPAQGSLSPKPSTSSNQMCWELYQMNLRDIKICINKLKMDNLSQHIIVTCKLLEDLPKSKYREEDYLSTLTAAFEAPKIDSYDTDTTIAYSSSDETIPYWPLEDNQQILMLPRSTSQNKTQNENPPKKRIIRAKPSMVSKFNINVHGIRRCWHRYYFKCIVKKCDRTFDKIKDWNTHHRIIHKNKIKCTDCGQKFATPSFHCAHKDNHAPCKFTCHSCKKNILPQQVESTQNCAHSLKTALLLLRIM